jgi:hypothetical protein
MRYYHYTEDNSYVSPGCKEDLGNGIGIGEAYSSGLGNGASYATSTDKFGNGTSWDTTSFPSTRQHFGSSSDAVTDSE